MNKLTDKILTKKYSFAEMALLFLFSIVFVYVVLRAVHLSFTHDESITYKIILGDKAWAHTANNHFLNTWLMQLFQSMFGSREWVLRLPNVLSFGLYLFFLSLLHRTWSDVQGRGLSPVGYQYVDTNCIVSSKMSSVDHWFLQVPAKR